jgi:hypothetical protein
MDHRLGEALAPSLLRTKYPEPGSEALTGIKRIIIGSRSLGADRRHFFSFRRVEDQLRALAEIRRNFAAPGSSSNSR